MQSKLFRFEVLRALTNGTFEARDPASGKPVLLYEWTPPVAEREAARQRLASVADELGAEVFTADASLYLAASSSQAGQQALTVLRRHELFTGNWASGDSAGRTSGSFAADAPEPFAAPPAPPTAPPAPPIAPPPLAAPFAPRQPVAGSQPPPKAAEAIAAGRPARRRSRLPLVLGGLTMAGLGLWAGYAIGGSRERVPARPVSIVDNAPSRATTRQGQQMQQLEAQLAAERQAGTELRAAVSGVHLLRLHNGCSTPVRAAVLYTGFNGERMAQGWVTIRPGETGIVASSPDGAFDVFASSADGSQSWGTESGKPIETPAGNFVYAVSAGLDQADKVAHGTFPVRVTHPTDTSALDCSAGAKE